MFLFLSNTYTKGIICAPTARRTSPLGSRSTSYFQPLASTKGFTLLTFWAWSIEIAMSLTPVYFCHSSYTSLMALNSLLQGLHHVAKKETTRGLSLLERVSRRTLFPSILFSVIWGNCALIGAQKVANSTNSNSQFFMLFVFLFWLMLDKVS